jgi:membrane fusion protein (multidrug efflux system)
MLGLLVLMASCGGDGRQAKSGDESGEDEAPPVPVEVSKPIRGNIDAIYKGTAPIEAFAEAEVVAKVAGEVRQILVEEGDVVRKGQVLARLDGDRLRLELEESSARLNKLKKDYERNTELRKSDLISPGDFEKIKFEMEAVQAEHNLASLELDYTQIRAPIDGVVSQRYTKLGTTLAVGQAAFRVTSLDPLVSYLHVPEREFRNVQPGQKVVLEIDALANTIITASVTRVSPLVDSATGTFKVTVEISDREQRVKPGMFARAGIVYDQHEHALQVPRKAVVDSAGEEVVFVIEKNKAERRVVTTGLAAQGMVEILSGLEDDANIVTIGHVGLKPGVAVTVINNESGRNDQAAEESVAETADGGTERAATD